MLDYGFFLDMAIILGTTKFLGIVSKRVQFPQVVGAILAGLLIGPGCFNIVSESDFLMQMSEVGVVLLMFSAGLETDIQQIKKTGFASILIATLGVLLPLVGGFGINRLFYSGTPYGEVLPSVFLGVVLTATSVSITVETLREMGKLKTKAGAAILGAAIIDDVLGVLVLSIVLGFKEPDTSPLLTVGKMAGFALFTVLFGWICRKVFRYIDKRWNGQRRVSIYSLLFCFLFAYIAEHFFGVADIIGAYFAGIMLTNTNSTEYVSKKVDTTSYLIFSPIFFASVGLNISFDGLDWSMLWFALAFLLVALLSKFVACGGAARLCKFTGAEAVCVGIGMISRGEVALIVAQKGVANDLINPAIFPVIVIVVVLTTLITPILLKLHLSKHPIGTPAHAEELATFQIAENNLDTQAALK